MAGNLRLPSVEQMEKDIKAKEDELAWRYYASERHTVQVDWVPFMSELAREVGVYPPIWKYFFTDPKLFCALVFGPAAAYQFRLTGKRFNCRLLMETKLCYFLLLLGPNSWPGARNAALTVKERIVAPLHTNSTKLQTKSSSFLPKLVMSLGFFSLLYFAFICPSPALSNNVDKITTYSQLNLLPKMPFF